MDARTSKRWWPSSRNSRKQPSLPYRDGRRSCRSIRGSRPTRRASRWVGCPTRIGMRRWRCSSNMAGSQRRSEPRSFTRTNLCRPLANSLRRKPDPARREANSAAGAVMADSNELLSTLAQKVSPAHAALLVIDVQNDFVANGGFFDRIGTDVKTIQRVIAPLARFVDCAREAGMLVVFIQATYDVQYLSAPIRERDLPVGRRMPRCLTGSWGADFHVIAPRPNEPVVIKHRYSAFAKPELNDSLKHRGIRSLLLTGVATDTCVESTGRDAYFMDYYVTLVADCCAGAAERDHRVALERFERDYGAVVNSADVIEAWKRSATLAMRPIASGAG